LTEQAGRERDRLQGAAGELTVPSVPSRLEMLAMESSELVQATLVVTSKGTTG
jgi:hypothetical protein